MKNSTDYLLSVPPELVFKLADSADPALRAKVLVDLLDYPEDDPDVLSARQNISYHPFVLDALAAFDHEKASWPGEHDKHYTGTHWTLEFLGDLGLPKDNPVIKLAIQHLLATAKPVNTLKGQRGKRFEGCRNGVYWGTCPVACMIASNLVSLCRYGHASQPITRAGFNAIRHLFDSEHGFSCEYMSHSLLPGCFMATPKVVKAWLAIPVEERTDADSAMIKLLCDHLKRYQLCKYVPIERKAWKEAIEGATPAQRRDLKMQWVSEGRHAEREAKIGWLKFGFPLGYNSDALEVMLMLSEASSERDSVIDEGLDLLLRQRGSDGMWTMQNSLNGKMWGRIEQKGKPSSWITYRLLLIFKRYDLLRIG